MRLEELRGFMRELVIETSLRAASKRVGLGHEALRKFIKGETERPHDRSKKAMAELFLERQKMSAAERESVPVAGQLKLLLPRGLEAATAAVTSLFAHFRASGRPPALAVDLERWLVRRLHEEYAREVHYTGGGRKRRGAKPGAAPEP